MLDAGLGLLEALQALAERHQQGAARDTHKQVLDCLQEGHALSTALERCPAAFPPSVCRDRTRERTHRRPGAGAVALRCLSGADGEHAREARHLLDLPAIADPGGGAVTLFLLAFVVPKFAAIYADLGRDQPLSSRLLMKFGSSLNEHGVLIASFAIAALAVGVHAVFNRSLRERLMRSIARLPESASACASCSSRGCIGPPGMVLRGGIPAVQALGMVGDCCRRTCAGTCRRAAQNPRGRAAVRFARIAC